MQSVFGSKSNFTLVRHEQNSGVSAAILTGIRHSETELVCSMDCDCSYDPLEFSRMLPLMTDDVDQVIASPYHPEGRVKNVPGWRLLLSKSLSTMYRIVLPQKLHTWTSCFRVYRKSVIEKLSLHETGFLGTAELVGQLCLNDSRIVEHPATLEVRIFGESKMKTFHTIAGHLRLVQQLVKQRLRGTSNTEASTSQVVVGTSELLIYRANHDAERRINLGNPLHKGVSMFPGSVDGWMGDNYVGGAAVVGDRLIFFGRQGKGYDFYGPADEYKKLTGGLEDPYGGKGYKCGPFEAVMWIYNLEALKKGDRSVVRMTFPWVVSPQGHCDLRNASVHDDTLYISEAAGEMWCDEPLPVIHALTIR
jgi:hypothetical protein